MKSPDDITVENIDLDGMQSSLDEPTIVFALLFGSYARSDADSASDLDIALRFADGLDARERFQLRNRIDAELQQYADTFVDVSDVERLPVTVAVRALRDGVLLAGDERAVEQYRDEIEREYESTADERERERRAFIDQLASGDA